MTTSTSATRSPAERIYYRMMRTTSGLRGITWRDLDAETRETYEKIAAQRPDLVPTEDYLAERDREAGIRSFASAPT